MPKRHRWLLGALIDAGFSQRDRLQRLLPGVTVTINLTYPKGRD